MATLQLTLESEDVQRNIRRLQQRVPSAVARALNRAQASANAVMVRNVAADLGLKQKDVRDGISLRQATVHRLQADIVAKGARIPLIKFGARGPEPSRGRGRGVTARIAGQRKRYPDLFIATLRSGHKGVFARVGGRRRSPRAWSLNLPIQQRYGPSMPHVFEKHIPEGLKRGEESLVKNLQHELRFAMRQSAGGA